MGSNKSKKRKFYCCYDYGMGGIWFCIYAHSKKEITEKYPFLDVADEQPYWFKPEYDKIQDMSKFRAVFKEKFTFDISDPPSESLLGLQKEYEENPPQKGWKKG